MPKKISVIKRIAISERNYKRNKIYKSTIKTLTKKYLISISLTKNDIDCKYLQIALSNLYSKIDKAVKRVYSIQIMDLEKKLLCLKH